jgi:hypothetical protein
MSCNVFLLSSKKGQIIIKDKQEKNGIENFFFKFIFCENIHLCQSQEYRIFWIYAIFTNTRVGNIRRNCSLTPESGT